MIPRFDAWTLARAVSGHEMNGEADALPEPFRSMVRRLADVRVDDALTGQARREVLAAARAPLWESMLSARPDRNELIKAMSEVDPEEPAPEADGDEEAADGWEPIRLGALPPAEPFPLDVLPEAAAQLVTEAATAIGCPHDFVAIPALVAAAGAIGRSVSLLVKPGYFAPASLYAGCVGPPSDGKTPALKAAAAAVRRIDLALADQYARDLERWEEESNRVGSDGKKQRPLPPPRPRRIDVDDITLESLPGILVDNPRGLVMIRDELSALFLGLNQYKAGGQGSDRPVLLKIWSGDSITRDRVTNADRVPTRCPYPCLSIVGGLPPDMLGTLADPKGRSDGFRDRFLFSFPEALPVPRWSERGVPTDVADAWCDLVARLWKRPMTLKEGRLVPHVARFTPEGKAVWTERFNAHAAEMNAVDFNPEFRGPWGKGRDYAARLALILACMDHAADPTADPEAIPDVGPRAVVNAWRLVDYFKSHARRVQAVANDPRIGGGPVVRAVVEWITKGPRRSFSERDIKQARRWIKDNDLSAALAYLTKRHAIRPRAETDEAPRVGHPRSPVYDVNPSLLDTQNSQNPQNSVSDCHSEDSESFESEKGGD